MARFSFFAVVFILSVTSSFANKVVDVDAICKQTTNTSFCSALLNSKPGGVGQDLISLAQYTLNVARANTTNTINLLHKLIAQNASDVEKIHYNSCLKHFGKEQGILGIIEDAQAVLKMKDYQSVLQDANSIRHQIVGCLKGDGPSDPPYEGSPLFPKYANVVDQIALIIFLIVKLI